MSRLPRLAKLLLALALIWGIAFALMWVAGYWEVTPEKISAQIRENPLSDASDLVRIEDAAEAKKRLAFIDEIADQVRKLNHAQRRRLRQYMRQR